MFRHLLDHHEMSGPRKSVQQGTGKLGRKPRYAPSPPGAESASGSAQAGDTGGDDVEYGDPGDLSMLGGEFVLPSVERGGHDSDDASNSDPFASDHDSAADSDEGMLFYSCLL